MFKLSLSEWHLWRDSFYKSSKRDKERLGQAFVIDHNLKNDQLFWLDDNKEAERLISEIYVAFVP